jgi:hypothetical protein
MIQYHKDGDAVMIRPRRDLNGLEAPAGAGIGDGSDIPAAELAQRFLSDKERSILRAVCDLRECKAKDVMDRLRGALSGNDFWVLWSSLQVRGLVQELDNGRFALGWHYTETLLG